MKLIKKHCLLWVPLLTYAASYAYLAFYHGKIFLFNTVVHEGGTFTLFETIFYASHFLGHLPSLTVIALMFTGSILLFFARSEKPFFHDSKLWSFLGLYLAASFILSLSLFGSEDTWSYLFQQKQSVTQYVKGGSWLLHLPSTSLLFVMIPIYLFLMAKIFSVELKISKNGNRYLLSSAGFTVFFTWIFTENLFESFQTAWTAPRYLAHSVRELATFPLTFFPIPLYFILRNHQTQPSNLLPQQRKMLLFSLLLFIVGFVYQCWIPLSHGIGELAQKPEFAQSGELSVSYLLASHYFEHVLDTVYFTLICLGFYRWAMKAE